MRAFSHILVPVDFTEKNRIALARAVEIAQPASARVTLLHVIEELEGADDQESDAFYDALRRRAEQKMQDLRESSSAQPPPASEIILGRRGPDILQFAAENDVDLIVMSSHVIDPGEPSRGWATLSYQVSIVCPCAILLVK